MKKTSEFIVMEITKEEMAMIIAKRNDEKEAKRINYIKELNTILHKLNEDGFTLGAGGCAEIKSFTSWGDAEGNWIKAKW